MCLIAAIYINDVILDILLVLSYFMRDLVLILNY